MEEKKGFCSVLLYFKGQDVSYSLRCKSTQRFPFHLEMFEIRDTEGFMAPRLLLLCCVFTTSLSSVVFQSPEFINRSVGESFTLKCARDLPFTYCYSSVSWFKVNPRTGKLDEVKQVNDELVDDKKSCSKTFTDVEVKDSGIYYCSVLNDQMVFIGKGTRVVITEKGPLQPSIIPYTPLEVEMDVDASSVLLQCAVMDAVPSQIRVWWLIDGEERTGWTESGWTRHDESASEYTRAQIIIAAEEWIEAYHTIECVVQYENMSISQTLQRHSYSDSSCTWLLYGGCCIAIFTIAVVITVALCLRKEKRGTFPVKRHRAGVDTQRKHQTRGKQDTLRTNLETLPANSEVEYSCLNPEIFKRQPSSPALELD
ncbi:M1-specific T cell receptor beta chain-like isoform 2-T2 [Clarias gariepinus]|uniref:immunoglobulin kappa light chain-like isoform X2 n=1 Tax=Clarias gariepinus TaxID=13013 RepID=UPI00234CA8EE|nr:immunoglobulin kappa light chain-like isoform X2 [Clarias gariepinus]